VYGAGRLVTFWLARSKEELAAAPSVRDAVAGVLGRSKADALAAETDGAIVRRETFEGTRRGDLSGE
jgi:hypothetical protein